MGATRLIYRAAGVLAGVAMIAIVALILAQIAARLLGMQIKSADDFAGWLLAASMFLALPMTLNRGEHIRVSVLSDLLAPRARRALDVIATLIGTAALLWGAWFVLSFVRESWTYHDVSGGLLAVPLWIPQLSMAVGVVLFAIAMIERLVRRLRGLPVADDDVTEQARVE